ncbi:MAG TPA: hypothetical protein VI300_29790 [Solirubrobacter sp.]
MKRNSQRGSTLLTTVVIITVVTIIGVGVVRFATREVAGAYAGAQDQALVACAETARQLLLSKFHALGTNPTSIAALNVPLDGPAASARSYAVGGHIDTQGITVAQVSYLPDSAFGPANLSRDLTNVVAPMSGQGGKPLKVVVHCQVQGDGTATGGRQLEVEFGVKFGL